MGYPPRTNVQDNCKNVSITFVEGDLQLGGLRGVLGFSRADDGKNASVVAKIAVSKKFNLPFILKKKNPHPLKSVYSERGACNSYCSKTVTSWSNLFHDGEKK